MNSTLSDLGNEIGLSLDRTGRGGMSAQLRNIDGTVAAPAVAFTGEPASGLYRAGATDVRLAVGGVDALKLTSGGIAGPITLASGTTGIVVAGVGGFLLLQGNQAAGQVSTTANPADVVAQPTVARTAGFIFQVQNPPSVGKLGIDWQGLLQLQNAAAIQPANVWTAIVPNANWSAFNGLGYWKDAVGTVHIKGLIGFVTGAGNPIFTLPAGFRPLATRGYHLQDAVSAAGLDIVVNANGDVSTAASPVSGHTYYMDPISFLAEA